MRTGLLLSLVSAPLFSAPLALALSLGIVTSALASDYDIDWKDGALVEQSDGSAEIDPPFVKINGVALSRFAQMYRVELHETIDADGLDGAEKVYVFRIWQGGASQGKQLMLVTTSKAGIDVIGPHEQDFETMEVVPANADQGPLFLLYGDGDGPIATLEYFSGQLIAQ